MFRFKKNPAGKPKPLNQNKNIPTKQFTNPTNPDKDYSSDRTPLPPFDTDFVYYEEKQGLKNPGELMRLSTSRFGEVNFAQEEIITFPEGILGLEGNLRYLILGQPESKPFLWLQSVDDPQVALPLMSPELLIPDYGVDLTAEFKAALQVVKNEKIDLYCIVHLEKEPESATVNLLTPLVVNPAKRLGYQVMVEKKSYTSRHNLFELLSLDKF